MLRTPQEPMGIAVIGAGYWGGKVVRETLKLSGISGLVRLESIVDNSPTILERYQEEYPDIQYRLDYKGLLDDPAISMVHICTPNSTHFEAAYDFLQAGKHVLVEKPLCLRTSEAHQLVRLARRNRRVLSTGHLHRFNNGVKALKSMLAKGVLGEPFYMKFNWTGLLPPQQQRDVVTDLAPHPLDIANNLLGEWPSRLTCNGKSFRNSGAGEEVAFITTEHNSGVTVSTEVSWLDQEKKRDVTVVGSRGSADLDCLEQKLVLRTDDSTKALALTPSDTLREEIVHFYECVRENELARPFYNQADGLLGAETVRVLEACQESMRLQRTVSIEPPMTEKIYAQIAGLRHHLDW
jgi:UDP-N-acetylglucosamine 3-dehydrogenase